MTRGKIALTVCLTALCTLPLGMALGRATHEPRALQPASHAEGVAPAATTVRLDETALRKLLREELRSERAKEVVRQTRAIGAQAPSEAAEAEADDAHARAEGLVDRAIAAKRWTQEDDLTLHRLFASMDAEQVASVSSKLFPAMNRGEVEPLHLAP